MVANGDTANKIGTYALSIAAKHHGIPFFIAAPTTTLDPNLPSGEHIEIEQRTTEVGGEWRGGRRTWVGRLGKVEGGSSGMLLAFAASGGPGYWVQFIQQ